jgi:hypothetical protein
MRLPIRSTLGCLLDVVSGLYIRCLRFLLDLEPLIDHLKLLHDLLLGMATCFGSRASKIRKTSCPKSRASVSQAPV